MRQRKFVEVVVKRIIRCHVFHSQFCITEDHAEHIVEIVCHPACKPANGLHFLRLIELELKFLTLFLGLPARG